MNTLCKHSMKACLYRRYVCIVNWAVLSNRAYKMERQKKDILLRIEVILLIYS